MSQGICCNSEKSCHFFSGCGYFTGSTLVTIGGVALIALGVGLASLSVGAFGYSFYAAIITNPVYIPLVIIINGIDIAFWCWVGFYCCAGGASLLGKALEMGTEGINEFKMLSASKV